MKLHPSTLTYRLSLKGDVTKCFPQEPSFSQKGRIVRQTVRGIAEMSEERLICLCLPFTWPVVLVNEWAVCVRVYSMCNYLWVYVNNICLTLSVSVGRKGNFLSFRGNMTELKTGNNQERLLHRHHDFWPLPIVARLKPFCGLWCQRMTLKSIPPVSIPPF